MIHQTLARNQKGFSLTELLLATGLLGVVVSLSGLAVVQQKILTQDLEIRSTIETEIALTRLTLMSENGVDMGLQSSHRQQVLACLSGFGEGCLGLSQSSFASPSSSAELQGFVAKPGFDCPTGSEAGCLFSKETQYRLDCDQDHRCFQLVFTVNLTPLGNHNRNLAPRSFSIPFTDRSVQARNQLDFSCAQEGGVVTGSNFNRLSGTCISFGRGQNTVHKWRVSGGSYPPPNNFRSYDLTYEYGGQTHSISTTFCPDGGTQCRMGRTFHEQRCEEGFETLGYVLSECAPEMEN